MVRSLIPSGKPSPNAPLESNRLLKNARFVSGHRFSGAVNFSRVSDDAVAKLRSQQPAE